MLVEVIRLIKYDVFINFLDVCIYSLYCNIKMFMVYLKYDIGY